MPTTGSGKFPYPASTAIPDVPADILLLAQRVSKMGGKGIGEASDSTALAAFISDGDATTGFTVYYSAADCIVRYNGAAFKLTGPKRWANVAAQTSWTTSYSGVLEVGSAGVTADTGISYWWDGAAWVSWGAVTVGTLGADSNGTVLYSALERGRDGWVDLQALTQRTGGTSYATSLILGVIPVGFRPAADTIAVATTYGAGTLNGVSISSTTGVVTLITASPAGHSAARVSARFKGA